jgi:hypothetical protein
MVEVLGPAVGHKLVERLPKGGRTLGGSRPAPISPYSLVGRKTDDDRVRLVTLTQASRQQVTNSRIVWPGVPDGNVRRAERHAQPQPSVPLRALPSGGKRWV